MAVSYLEISYPNFVLGSIIDPAEANQNNNDLVTKTNDIITSLNSNESSILNLASVKADKIYVDSQDLNLAGVGRTVETIKQNASNLITHKTSNDHDYKYYTKILLDAGQLDNRYYTELEINAKELALNNSITLNTTKLTTHKTSTDHDSRYYTKEDLIPWLRGGDTLIREETYVIVNPNLGDDSFSYTYNGQEFIGVLTSNGGMMFDLKTGFYQTNQHRIDVMVDDTLRRSVASGGLVESSETSFVLTNPEDVGTEITVKYFERLGLIAEYNIKMSAIEPPISGGKNMWFKII